MSVTMPAGTQVRTRVLRLQGGGLRFLDSQEMPDESFQVVTRPFDTRATTQHWRVIELGGDVSTIQQVSSGRFLEATVDGDFTVVTRPAGNSEQTWRIGGP